MPQTYKKKQKKYAKISVECHPKSDLSPFDLPSAIARGVAKTQRNDSILDDTLHFDISPNSIGHWFGTL